MGDPNSLLRDSLRATPIRGRSDHKWKGSGVVEWSEDEAAILFHIIHDWWQSSGRAQGQRLSSNAGMDFLAEGSFRGRIHHILNVLACIVIPRIPRDSPTASEVVRFIAELEQQGQATEAVLPALLLIRDDPDVASRLRHGLVSADEDEYISALRGVLYWVDYAPRGEKSEGARNLPPIPQDLVQELAATVASRRQPWLLKSLEVVLAILRRGREVVDSHFRQALLVGLDYLLLETAYRPFERLGDRIPYDEVPNVRRLADAVAAVLRYRYNESHRSSDGG